MNDHMQTPQDSPAPLRKPFAPPSLERLGALASVTRGPGIGAGEDAIIFQAGGDPSDDPS